MQYDPRRLAVEQLQGWQQASPVVTMSCLQPITSTSARTLHVPTSGRRAFQRRFVGVSLVSRNPFASWLRVLSQWLWMFCVGTQRLAQLAEQVAAISCNIPRRRTWRSCIFSRNACRASVAASSSEITLSRRFGASVPPTRGGNTNTYPLIHGIALLLLYFK